MMKTKTNKKLSLPQVEEEITEDTEFETMVEVTTDDLFAVWENASINKWKCEHSKEFHACINGEFKLIWTHEKGMVEEEIEITEDTVIPKVLVMFEHNGNTHIEQHDSKCINEILSLDKKVKGSVTKTIHACINGEFKLIWTHEKGMVE